MIEQYKYGVGVVCTTFNQINYVRQCLDSLVSQKTAFCYKIIVHDDASTDGTSDVVRDYVQQYPHLIQAIIQNENIYSRGISYRQYTDAYLNDCKYVAVCEGDDWWDSSDKLQVQYEYMEQHPDCSLCVHDVTLFDDHRKKAVGVVPGNGFDKDYSFDEVVIGGGGLFGTNSMFYRVKDRNEPEEYLEWGIGDYPLAIWLSTIGTVHCIGRVMSSYRVNAEGSWTKRHCSSSEVAQQQNDKIIEGLKAVDCYMGYEHHLVIERAIEQINDNTIRAKIDCGFNKGCKPIRPGEIDDLEGFVSRQPAKLKIILLIKLYLPFINSIRLLLRRRR